MAFDGTVIACLADELNSKLLSARITKVAQPEKDALLLTLKNAGSQYRLFLSVNASLPLIYLTENNIPSPATAPAFCMLLRKHLAGGKIVAVTQPSMERILNFEIEHYNEMGDLCRKTLIVELMGKHSNIILTEDGRVMDSIKHISAMVSSVREVLPGRPYFIPFEGEKLDPLSVTERSFSERIFTGSLPLAKALYSNLTGFSPALSEEILFRTGLDSSRPAASFSEVEQKAVFAAFSNVMDIIRQAAYTPNIVYKGTEPVFYAPFSYDSYKNEVKKEFSSISEVLYTYYAEKQSYTSIRQKTADLRQVISGLLSKDYKKYDLQIKQLKDTEKRDKYKLYGELLTAYGYSAEPKSTSLTVTDYYSDSEIAIPLDPTMSAIENAKKYYARYAKLKRTNAALSEIIKQTKDEIDHLESISVALNTVKDQADIAELKKEMTEAGYIRAKTGAGTKNGSPKKAAKEKSLKSEPLHYLSCDGYDIYVGKNNYQNEFLSFKLAEGNDWWFHAKKIPGSHVIVKTRGEEIPDSTFEEAARLAAHYSKAASAGSETKVEIDYIQRKHLKKTPGGKPGFVIYHTNYSMTVSTDITGIKEVSR